MGLVARDFRMKYMNSLFGTIWAILNPLALILVYTIVFSQIMKAKIQGIDDAWAYSIYLIAGMLPWQLFADSTQRLTTIFLDQSNLLKKASFPRTTLPIFVLLSAGFNFLIIFVIFMIVYILLGHIPNLTILGIIPLLLLQQVFALGLGILLGTLNIFFRDIGHAFGIIIQFWFWLTPIVYPVAIIPKLFSGVFKLNVLAPVIEGYQTIFLYRKWPDYSRFLPILIISILLFVGGYIVFKKLDKEMVDEL